MSHNYIHHLLCYMCVLWWCDNRLSNVVVALFMFDKCVLLWIAICIQINANFFLDLQNSVVT